MRAYFEQARVAGADAVLCCCSSVGDVVDRARAEAPIPLLRIDEPMAVEAVQSGRRIGVIATVRTTLEPTVGLIRRKAQELGRAVEVEPVLVQGAFDALSAGDGAAHDRLVKEALIALLKRSDVVVLAQASIARVLAALEQPPAIPVLTSPLSGLKAAGAILAE